MPSRLDHPQDPIFDFERLAAVAATRLLDTPPEPAFDRVARLARGIYRTQAAFVSLIDGRRVFRKAVAVSAAQDAPARELPVASALCTHVVLAGVPLALGDARLDERFVAHPAVREGGVVAYAGVPLVLDGQVLGALCVTDPAPRVWDETDLEPLATLAEGLVAEIARRSASARLEQAERAYTTLADTLRLAMSATRLATFEWDLRHDFVAWSDNLEGLLGLAPGAFGGTFEAFIALVHPEDRARVRAALQQALAERAGYACDFRMLRPDGGVRWTETRGRVLCDAAGEPVKLIGVDVDVTERRERQAQRDAEHERLQMVMQASSTVCFEWDIAADRVRRLYSTEAALRPTAEAAFETLEDVLRRVHPEDREQLRAALHAAMDSPDGRYQAQFRVLRPDGSVGWLAERGRVEFDAQGRPARLTGVAHDETARRALEAQREQAMAQLRREDRSKDEFLATLAHELRNPLAPIANAVGLLAHCNLDDPVLAQARTVLERQSAQLARLVDDLLDVSRVASGKVVLQHGVHDVRALVEAGVETARPLIEHRFQQLVMSLPPAGALCVEGDLARLTQVVANLVTNAAKYTPQDGCILVSALRAADGGVEISVTDDGIGIDAALLPRVFDLFVQADGASARSGGGLGIGLAMVRKLVELHGGSVSAHSDGPGKGSRFVIRLPAAAAPATPAAAPTPGPAAAAVAAAAAGRVLVVDDNRDAAESLAMLLQLEGWQASVCHDGLQARELARTQAFDAVVLDLHLPGLDGMEVARALRARGASRKATLVAVTGHAQPEDRARTAQAGFDAHLVKPVELKDLLGRLAGLETDVSARLAQRIGHAALHRFFTSWRELRGTRRWPALADLLQASEPMRAQRVVVAVEALSPQPVLRVVEVGTGLDALLPQSLTGQVLDDAGATTGTGAAYLGVALGGEPAHERVEMDFGDGAPLCLERLVVPAADNPAALQPTHLVSVVLLDPPA